MQYTYCSTDFSFKKVRQGDSSNVPNNMITELQAEIRTLGSSVRGLGTAMATLADQNKTFTTSMDHFAQAINQLVSGQGLNPGRTQRTASRRDADAMEVDNEGGGAEGADADDESEPLPVKLPRRKKAFKLTSLPVRRSEEENALKVRPLFV